MPARDPLSCQSSIVNRMAHARRLREVARLLFLLRMTDRRLILALGRLERALARVEADISTSPRPMTADESEALFRLAERHRSLREATESAIARIDRLLGSD